MAFGAKNPAALGRAILLVGIGLALVLFFYVTEKMWPQPASPREVSISDRSLLPVPFVSWVRTSFATARNSQPVRHELRLEDEVVVTVLSVSPPAGQPASPTDPISLAAWAKSIEPTKPVEDTLNKLVPYVNGIAIKGTYPVSIESPSTAVKDPAAPPIQVSRFHYRLMRTELSKDAWTALLGRPGSAGQHRPITFTIGSEAGHTLATAYDVAQPDAADETQLELMAFSSWWPGIAIAMIALMIWFLYKAQTSNLLRDSDCEPDEGKLAPYSLARVQMAVWLFLVVTVYILIWFITRERSDLPASVLVLIGLSSATTIGSLIIDANKRTKRRELRLKMAALEERLGKLTAQRAAADPANSAALDSDIRLAEGELQAARTELGELPTLTQHSENFLDDILSDRNGVSFHRLRIAIWTVTLALVFVVTAWRSLGMPVFSEGLLALMGISSGTYLGFKGTEN